MFQKIYRYVFITSVVIATVHFPITRTPIVFLNLSAKTFLKKVIGNLVFSRFKKSPLMYIYLKLWGSF